MATIESKSDFARRCNVTPARVSQWIAEGKISGEALVGEGRAAQINVELALPQVRARRDVDQAHSLNGLGTTLDAPIDGATAPSSSAPPPDSIESKIAHARLEGLERANRRGAIDEAERLGDLVNAAAARAQTSRVVGRVVTRLEGSLAELANAIAAEFKLAPRDVLHLLRQKFREIRRAAALEERERAEPLPERVGHELGDQ